MRHLSLGLLALLLVSAGATPHARDLFDDVEHAYAENDGVRLHYARLGDGDTLVVLIHGFPDYWYSWRHQMPALAMDHTVAALDQRGYNRSDAPEGVEAYRMANLVGDVLAVIRAEGRERAVVVGHDWGAAVAWQVAMNAPDTVERLVILSVPHPAGFRRELSTNEAQQADSQYARDFQRDDSHESLTAAGLAGWVREPAARARYVEAFERSSFAGMMNYYRANYPRSTGAPTRSRFPRVRCPVLVIHGLKDRALHASGHNDTWEQVDAETTLYMLPQAGHFVQRDAAERVTTMLLDWLAR